MISFIKKYPYLMVAVWGSILFIPFLGSVHLFDWDEINFAESAREMLVTGNFQQVQINYQPFIEKPPLFFWIQALSMKIFGVNEFAARFPNAIIGIISLLFVFKLGSTHKNKIFAALWVLFITGSFTPHLYFKSGIIDPLYNLLIFAACYQLYMYLTQSPKAKHAFLLGIFLGLAIITKGPVAVLILVLVLTVYAIIFKFKLNLKPMHIALAALMAFLVSAAWFGIETINNGPSFLAEFIKYQIDLFLNPVAGHGQPFYYHPLVLLFGAFPASVIALPALFKKQSQQEDSLFTFFRVMFWVVLILFSIVTTKIVHYSSLCYLPLTGLAAHYLSSWFEPKEKTFPRWQLMLLMFTGIVIGILFSLITLVDLFKDSIIPLVDDAFAVGNLSMDGAWRGYEIFLGLFLLAVIIVAGVQVFKGKILQAMFMMLLYIAILIPVFLRIVVPHIERYSQRSAIDFFEQKQKEDCYVACIGFRSYAQYFYTRVLPHKNSNAYNESWLLTGNLDKPAYFVLKEGNTENHLNNSMQEFYRQGGFIFYRREPGKAFTDGQMEPK